MALGLTQSSTTGFFHRAQGLFLEAADQCEQDLNAATGNTALALWYMNKALFAELTQMSQDIAALKAEVASLKSKPGLLSSSHASAHTRPIPDSWAR